MSNLIHKELSESIIGCAMTVLNTLRPGLDEKLYENAETTFGSTITSASTIRSGMRVPINCPS